MCVSFLKSAIAVGDGWNACACVCVCDYDMILFKKNDKTTSEIVVIRPYTQFIFTSMNKHRVLWPYFFFLLAYKQCFIQ